MGKNAIVGQSGGPTSVINASLAGVFESCKNRGADIVYGMCNGVAGLLEVLHERTPRYSEIFPFFCVRAYTLRRDSKGAMPLGTQTLEQSLVCYTLPEVYTLSRYARTQRLPPMRHIG